MCRVNRDTKQLVAAIPDQRSLGFTDVTGDLDRTLDTIFAGVLDPDEFFVRALNGALGRQQRALVYRYAIRLLARGLTNNDAQVVPAAATALAIATYHEDDYRNLMLNLAPLHVAAARLTGDASPTLDWIAARLPDEQRGNLRAWGRRPGITLETFRWKETTTEDGTKLEPC